jgi:transcription elongation factor Elf1
MELEIEKKFKCPYCLEKISMLIDLSEEGQQQYIEDCEVCCQPIQVSFEVSSTKLAGFRSARIQ